MAWRAAARVSAGASAELERLLADDSARVQLGREARATVERCFTWQRCGEATVAAYERACFDRFQPASRG